MLCLANDDVREARKAFLLERGEEGAEGRDSLVGVEAVEVERDFGPFLDGEAAFGAGQDGLGRDAEADAAAAFVASGAAVGRVVRRAGAAFVAIEGFLDETLAFLDDPIRRVTAWEKGGSGKG